MRCDGFEVFFVSWCDMCKTGLVWAGRLAKSKLEFSQRLTRAAWFGLGWCTSVCTQSLLWLLQTAIECSNRPDVCTLELYIAQQLIQRAMRSGGLSISLWQTYYSLSLNALLTQWIRFVTPLIGRGWLEMGVLRNMKYENGGNQRSRAAPQIRRVLSRPKNNRFWRVFYPIPPIFFAFSPFPRTYKTNFAKKIRSGLHFLAAVEAQSFCLNSGRVATAYSTDKYKYQNHENKSQLSRAIYYYVTIHV